MERHYPDPAGIGGHSGEFPAERGSVARLHHQTSSRWWEQHRIGELADIEPLHVAAYIEALQAMAAKPTVKQHRAAIRMLFDWLIIGQVLAVNPAHAVRGPKHVVRRGKTPVLTEDLFVGLPGLRPEPARLPP
jgi:hypothetical protein